MRISDFIKEKFYDIVKFSELHSFLDVPIKNFSSGMSTRLGFSIATLVKPNILIIDEVLSVGDAAFQEKCVGKMEELRSGGTTMLFVSHSIAQVRKLCNRAIWLRKGEIIIDGSVDEVSAEYEQWTQNHSAFE